MYWSIKLSSEPDETGEDVFEPDWNVTWLYRDKDNPEEYMYYEQDPIDTAVHNFLTNFKEN